MDIDKTPLIFVRDLKKEYFEIPNTVYFPFSPVQKSNKGGKYLEINFRKKDSICYIKHKTKNLWLYYKNGKAIFKPLHCKKTGFYYEQPTVCWIQYLKEPTFMIYKPIGYGKKEVHYLVYNETDKTFNIRWSKFINEGTVFSFNKVIWSTYLSETVDTPITFG
jgi:hypothetical protein